jgi:tyrosyl-tRNA synthetase
LKHTSKPCSIPDMELHFTPEDCLDWGVAEIIGREALESALRAGKPVRVKLGIDPTSPNVHLGRSLPLWRLRAFQELGAEIQLIIGDYTGQVGDTSDKDAERPMLSAETIQKNLEAYIDQIWMVLNPERKDQVTIHYNSAWLEPMTLGKLSQMADAFSVNDFIKRELIARRLESGSRVSLREMLYPLMQGYDSVMVKADVELGGTDQRFNLLAGRLLQEQAGQPAQSLIMNVLISGTDGRKMSSSWGNVISLLDTPKDKFGKLMATHDDVIQDYLFALPVCAIPFTGQDWHLHRKEGKNPRDLKLLLAERIVELYHGAETAVAEREGWIAQFSESQVPENLEILEVKAGLTTLEALEKTGWFASRGDVRRALIQNGVRLEGVVLSDPAQELVVGSGVLQYGKRHFVRLNVAE